MVLPCCAVSWPCLGLSTSTTRNDQLRRRASLGRRTSSRREIRGNRRVGGGPIALDRGRQGRGPAYAGIFFRVDDNSSVRMISPGLADTVVALQKGRAMVEVADIRPENNVRVTEGGASAQLLKAGLYDFDADRGVIRVFDGKASVQTMGRLIEVNSGRQVILNATGKPKARKFDKKAYADDFYRWGSLRSSYLAEANVDAARAYGDRQGTRLNS